MNTFGNRRRAFLSSAAQAIVLLAGASSLVRAAAGPEEPAMPHPLVPFSTVVDTWDHHWFLWLPHHPHYEAVEIASRDAARDGSVAVWVWFTERAGPKRQIHYRNDRRSAGFVGGHYRPIAYQISGEDEHPRSVQVRFDDIESVPVN